MKLEKKIETPAERKGLSSIAFKKMLPLAFLVLIAFFAGLFLLPLRALLFDGIGNLFAEIRLYQASPLPTIFLDIPYESLNQIQLKRSEALEEGILISSDEDFVPASYRLEENGEEIPIELRLKGDWTDHLLSDKWSFRIHINDDNATLFGMQRFSLQSPSTRTFVNEWIYHQNLMDEGVLTTRYYFVNVLLNGEHKGIYALEESFTQDLLEAQQRREGIIFRLNEDISWKTRNQFFNGSFQEHLDAGEIGHFLNYANPIIYEMTPYRGNRVSESATLSEEMTTAANLLTAYFQGNLPADQVLDTELWGKFYAISDLWGAAHGMVWHNLRLYYNPITGLIEPVVFDALPLNDPLVSISPLQSNSMRIFFNDPAIQKAYVSTLERITTEDYVGNLKNIYGDEAEIYYLLLNKEYSKKGNTSALFLPWESLSFRREVLQTNLSPVQLVRGGYTIEEIEGEWWVRLDLINLVIEPVELDSIQFQDQLYTPRENWCTETNCAGGFILDEKIVLASGLENNFRPVSFRFKLKDYQPSEKPPTLTVAATLYGGTQTITSPVLAMTVPDIYAQSPVPEPDLATMLTQNSFIEMPSETEIFIPQGNWKVTGDLVIPEGIGLQIEAGTTLSFEENSVLLTSGPLFFSAVDQEPIILTAQGSTWGGIVVLESSEISIWHNVIVEKTSGIAREGWILTGGVTFYKSPVRLMQVVFDHSTAEDSLNIVNTEFVLDTVTFSNAASDGFDGDFTTGEVSNGFFTNIQGDGLDFSGSQVDIADSIFIDISDKAISIGEQSQVTIQNVRIQNVEIGIASKDLSEAVLDFVEIDNASLAGLAAYIKKPQYGPATMVADNTTITKTETTALCQIDNTITLNGAEIEEVDLDIAALYP